VSEFVAIDHPRFRRAERSIFLRQVVADCMAHACRLRKHGDRPMLDACCQYGADVDVAERDAILGHADQLRAILSPEARDAPWFTAPETVDADFPSGRHVRTATFGDGCVFLAHDGRGCAIHRASIEGGWDFHGTKPHVCRLFPLSYAGAEIVLSDDHPDYSCAIEPGAPTVYRVARDTIGAVFGAALVAALDAAEAAVLADEAARRPAGLAVVG
jgi:Fe-S-cluster containining protein